MSKTVESKKLTKKQNLRVLIQFNNLCATLNSLSPEFIVYAVEDIQRKNLDDTTKQAIAVKATEIFDNPVYKEKLPPEWAGLIVLPTH